MIRRAAAAAAAGLVLAACNGPQGREPEAWAAQTCGNLRSWMHGIQARSEEYAEALGQITATEPVVLTPQVRSETLDFVDDVIVATDGLLVQIEESGTPAVEDGPEVVDTFRRGITELRDGLTEARGDVADAGPGDLQQRLEDFGATLQAAAGRVGAVFDEAEQRGLGGDELDEAFRTQPACAGLGV